MSALVSLLILAASAVAVLMTSFLVMTMLLKHKQRRIEEQNALLYTNYTHHAQEDVTTIRYAR